MKFYLYRLINYTLKEIYYGTGDAHVCILEKKGKLQKINVISHWKFGEQVIISKNIAMNLTQGLADKLKDKLQEKARTNGFRLIL